MKRVICLVLLAIFGVLASGCATPAYSSRERFRLIARNWGYEWRQIQDDVDHALLLRPAGNLTIWHARGAE